MKHGEKRGEMVVRRTRDENVKHVILSSGIEVRITPGTLTETGHERWCETCQEWVLSLGVIANLMCHQCHTPW